MIYLKECYESRCKVFSFYDPNEEVFYALKKHNDIEKYKYERKILELLDQ
jgi:hypothetical protein